MPAVRGIRCWRFVCGVGIELVLISFVVMVTLSKSL